MTKSLLAKYKKHTRSKLIYGILSIIILIILFLLSIGLGPVKISISQIISILAGDDSTFHYNIIWNIRLPRTLTAMISGMGLAIAGN
ncbi:MAG: iron chelate uptake ABC transporter family permease subunit, partial [Halanaerobiales bacterium]